MLDMLEERQMWIERSLPIANADSLRCHLQLCRRKVLCACRIVQPTMQSSMACCVPPMAVRSRLKCSPATAPKYSGHADQQDSQALQHSQRSAGRRPRHDYLGTHSRGSAAGRTGLDLGASKRRHLQAVQRSKRQRNRKTRPGSSVPSFPASGCGVPESAPSPRTGAKTRTAAAPLKQPRSPPQPAATSQIPPTATAPLSGSDAKPTAAKSKSTSTSPSPTAICCGRSAANPQRSSARRHLCDPNLAAG